MAKLDYQYISNLIENAKRNDGNACAELFAATYPSVYSFSCVFLEDEELAKETLNKTYVQGFSSLHQLQNNGIFVHWLLQINCRICLEYKPVTSPILINGKEYSMSQLLKLPLSESLTLIMKYHNKLKNREIAKIMDITSRRVTTSANAGIKRLRSLGA